MHPSTFTSCRLVLLAVLASTLRVAAVETPRRSDDFIDTIGINAHLDVPSNVYIEAPIGQLGIRHLRSNVEPGVMATLQARLDALHADYGATVNLVCDSTSYTPAQYQSLLHDVTFESIEGLNEPDVVGPRSYKGLTDNWVTQSYPATLAYQQDLFTAVNNDTATSAKAILSPAMANPSNSSYLRSVAADYISMHSYPAQQMPSGNFLASYAIAGAQLMATPGGATMRIVATETGYKSGASLGDISGTAARKYIPRMFAEYFRLGIARTYLFEMMDVAGEYDFGILDSSLNPKPAYYAVQNLISLLHESTWNAGTASWVAPATFNPGLLDYTISSDNANVHHVLLQKSNGKIDLLLWQEVPSFDLTSFNDIANPTVPVSVTVNLTIASASLYQLNSTTPVATYSNVATFNLNIPDEVVILEMTPGIPPVVVVPPAGPTVAVEATAPVAVPATSQPGVFTVTRTGSTAAALSVSYTVAGTATGSVDYTSLSGSVTIPAGATQAAIAVNPANPALLGRKTVVLTLSTNSNYTLATPSTATVAVGFSRTVVANFESNAAGWAGNAGASTTWDTTHPDTGHGDLKAVLAVDGVNRWINNFQWNFSTPQDWSAVNTLEIRVQESASNPMSDVGQALYFAWYNNGVGVGGGYGVGKIPLSHNTNYSTVSLDLGNFPRDKVTAFVFYIDGAAIQPGNHVLYFDNLVAVTGTSAVIEDFEQSGVSAWQHGGQSALQVDTQNVDGGSQAMKWTFSDVSTQRWDNSIQLNFPQPVDLSLYSTLSVRIKESASNPGSDVNSVIYFDWSNDGVRVNGDAGVTSLPLTGTSSYRTVLINLAEFPRGRVDHLSFYIDGGAFATGQHVWYIDNITAY